MRLDRRTKAIWVAATHRDTNDLIAQSRRIREETAELLLILKQTRLSLRFSRRRLRETTMEIRARCQMKPQPTTAE